MDDVIIYCTLFFDQTGSEAKFRGQVVASVLNLIAFSQKSQQNSFFEPQSPAYMRLALVSSMK